MSLLRETWNDGEAINTVDLNRANDVGAGADDRAFESLFPPGSVPKRIVPLDSMTADPTTLIIPGATAGAIKLQPCTLIAGSATTAPAIRLSGTLLTALQSALVTSNSSGSTRIDLLYATLTRSTPATIGSPPTGTAYVGTGEAVTGTGAQQSRTVKDPTSGNITTQTINIYDVPTVTLTILPGTPGAGVPPALPADGASAFNFSLASVTVLNGYTSGTAIAKTAISPLWSMAGIPSFLIRGISPRDQLREQWIAAISESGVNNHVLSSAPNWTDNITNASGAIVTQASPYGGLVGRVVKVTPSSNSGALSAIYTSSDFLDASFTGMEFFAEFDLAVDVWSLPTSNTIAFGLSDVKDPTNSSCNSIRFLATSTDANWQSAASSGGTLGAAQDTGVAITPQSWYRFRLEIHGSATALGRVALEGGSAGQFKYRFFVNGQRVVTISQSSGIGTSMAFFAAIKGTTSASSGYFVLSPVSMHWNRVASPGAL